MNQAFQMQSCPRCGSFSLEPGYDKADGLHNLLFRSNLYFLLKAFLGRKNSAYWICRNCGCKFPINYP